MNNKTGTDKQIREEGMELLKEKLGLVGMIRFLQQGEKGAGDYTKERKQWMGKLDVLTLAREIQNSPANREDQENGEN